MICMGFRGDHRMVNPVAFQVCSPQERANCIGNHCNGRTGKPGLTIKSGMIVGLKHLPSEKTRFYCPQAFLSVDLQCRDDVFMK